MFNRNHNPIFNRPGNSSTTENSTSHTKKSPRFGRPPSIQARVFERSRDRHPNPRRARIRSNSRAEDKSNSGISLRSRKIFTLKPQIFDNEQEEFYPNTSNSNISNLSKINKSTFENYGERLKNIDSSLGKVFESTSDDFLAKLLTIDKEFDKNSIGEITKAILQRKRLDYFNSETENNQDLTKILKNSLKDILHLIEPKEVVLEEITRPNSNQKNQFSFLNKKQRELNQLIDVKRKETETRIAELKKKSEKLKEECFYLEKRNSLLQEERTVNQHKLSLKYENLGRKQIKERANELILRYLSMYKYENPAIDELEQNLRNLTLKKRVLNNKCDTLKLYSDREGLKEEIIKLKTEQRYSSHKFY